MVVSVRPDPCPLQLVLLDAGIVAQLSDHDLANFKAVFTAVVLRQVRTQRPILGKILEASSSFIENIDLLYCTN